MHYEKAVFDLEMFAYRNTEWRSDLRQAILELEGHYDQGACSHDDPDAPWWASRIVGLKDRPKYVRRAWRSDVMTLDSVAGICPSPIVVNYYAIHSPRHHIAAERMGITHDYFVELMRGSNVTYEKICTPQCSMPRDMQMYEPCHDAVSGGDHQEICAMLADQLGVGLYGFRVPFADLCAQLALFYRPEKVLAWRNRVAARVERALMRDRLAALAPLDMMGDYECMRRISEIMQIDMNAAHAFVEEMGGVDGVKAWRERLCR